MQGVVEVWIAAESRRLSLADAGGLVEAKNRGEFAVAGGHEEISGDDLLGRVGVIADFLANQVSNFGLFQHFHAKRHGFLWSGHFPHHLVQVRQDMPAADLPFFLGLDRLPLA